MPQQGADIDIVTGRPRIQELAELERINKNKEDERLERQAQYAELLHSATGEKLLGIIQLYLDQRIHELVQTDPQAMAYIKILSDLGVRDAVGRHAAGILMNRYLKKKEENKP